MPGDGRGGSVVGTATPLLTPSMHASRSPMKRALAVAQSPSRRGLAASGSGPFGRADGSGGGGLRPSASSGSLTSLRGAMMNRLKLPRRHASGAGGMHTGRQEGRASLQAAAKMGAGSAPSWLSARYACCPVIFNRPCSPAPPAGEDFGEFAFRPSRLASPSGSPSHGSPSGAIAATEAAAGGGIFSFGGPSRFGHHARSPSKGSPAPPVTISADGTTSAARGLAAALAALPPGSPLGDGTPTAGSAQLLGTSSGVGMSDNPAFASGGTPEASGQSTPASDRGGPARRPLLARALCSSDAQPLDPYSPERWQRRQAELHAGDGSRPPSAEPEPASAEQQGQQQPQQPVERSSLSLSLGRGLGLADVGSISLNGSGSDECEADTAASRAQPGAAGSVAAAGAQLAGATGMEPAGGSSVALLALEQQALARPSSGGTEGGERSGSSSVALLPPRPPGQRVRGSDALVALDLLPAAPRHQASSSYDVAAALGYEQTPPDPQEIFAAIVSKGAAEGGSEGRLPAVYGSNPAFGLAGAAEAGARSEPGGGEGIATRWWAAQQG